MSLFKAGKTVGKMNSIYIFLYVMSNEYGNDRSTCKVYFILLIAWRIKKCEEIENVGRVSNDKTTYEKS